MIRLIWIPIVCAAYFPCAGQQLVPSVISTAGGYSSNANGSLSFTAGEMAAIQTFSNGENILTQGFQQPVSLGTWVEDPNSLKATFDVYPNPSDGFLNVRVNGAENFSFEVALFDVFGHMTDRQVFFHSAPQTQTNVEYTAIPSGTYILRMRAYKNGHSSTYIRNLAIIK